MKKDKADKKSLKDKRQKFKDEFAKISREINLDKKLTTSQKNKIILDTITKRKQIENSANNEEVETVIEKRTHGFKRKETKGVSVDWTDKKITRVVESDFALD